jgi:hypothetical protein
MSASCRRGIRRWPHFGDQPQNLAEQHPWRGDLGHLKRNAAPVADDLRADLDTLPPQAREEPLDVRVGSSLCGNALIW